MNELMKCGHTANATKDGKPFCVICMCEELAAQTPTLDGRVAKCSYCGKESSSSYNLPFFKYEPNAKYDRYYCGCGGWD